jgi:1-phosphofructokinase family hexose kinase
MADRRSAILTLTPNPSLDLLFEADALVWDDANRLPPPRRRPGGQGVNLTRAARVLGADARAVALLGGATGREIAAALHAEGTPLTAVEAPGETRVFVGVRVRGGASLLLNPGGPGCGADVARALLEAVRQELAARPARWLVCCGSLPPGLPDSLYADAAGLADAAGARFVVDCDGDALRAAAPRAHLLAPNQHEARRLTGLPAGTVAEARMAAAAMLSPRCRTAAVTLGEAGAVLATPDGAWHAAPAPSHAGTAVGAGDCFLAALILALDNDLPAARALASAVAAGSAALRSTGAAMLERADVEAEEQRVTVRRLE